MSDVLYENGSFWVARKEYGTGRLRPKTKGFAVYQSGITHSVCVAQIGYEGAEGLRRAIVEADRRANS